MQVKELRAKTPTELNQLIEDLKAELFMLRFKNSTGQLDQPHKISLIKKEIARVFTVIHELNSGKEVLNKTAPKAAVKAKAKVEEKLAKEEAHKKTVEAKNKKEAK